MGLLSLTWPEVYALAKVYALSLSLFLFLLKILILPFSVILQIEYYQLMH